VWAALSINVLRERKPQSLTNDAAGYDVGKGYWLKIQKSVPSRLGIGGKSRSALAPPAERSSDDNAAARSLAFPSPASGRFRLQAPLCRHFVFDRLNATNYHSEVGDFKKLEILT
jgi:hypothetical protein